MVLRLFMYLTSQSLDITQIANYKLLILKDILKHAKFIFTMGKEFIIS